MGGGTLIRGLMAIGVALFSANLTSLATEGDVTASAELVTPIDILGEGDLSFGTLAIPRTGSCVYDVSAIGTLSASGATDCQGLSGQSLPAEFSVACDADALVTFELIYTNSAPAGATFSSPSNPMSIDGFGAGSALQTIACDTDGLSDVTAGGRLTVTPSASSGFSGQVGTIRLEAQYE
ncbi:DUF4402 domain-containing protein [Ponticaulis sp.]|uniref:DUF4402 domain-containing protein n=1 Tax=Ponticaulis sp. TaxID=2020902 RepID=UPI000B68913F|nr:DUF4402 domain-containing protein [Ponticaulis sp.]MAI91221.1 hypothetical protein [Ponticaulis sp.]OUX98534.1 MAG: hypothetical protein CBB65_12305 [Hyphomonadaceae bacterium TMED5]